MKVEMVVADSWFLISIICMKLTRVVTLDNLNFLCGVLFYKKTGLEFLPFNFLLKI